MFQKKNSLKILVISTLLVITVFKVSSRRPPGGSAEGPERNPQSLPGKGAERRTIGSQEGTRAPAQTKARDQTLVELKKRWQEYFDLKKSGGDKQELHLMMVRLAEESG